MLLTPSGVIGWLVQRGYSRSSSATHTTTFAALDLADALDARQDLFDLAGGEECWWKGELDIHGTVRFDSWDPITPPGGDHEIHGIFLDGGTVDLDWLDVLGLVEVAEDALWDAAGERLDSAYHSNEEAWEVA